MIWGECGLDSFWSDPGRVFLEPPQGIVGLVVSCYSKCVPGLLTPRALAEDSGPHERRMERLVLYVGPL